MQQSTIIIITCIILAVAGVWTAWARPSKAHLVLRLVFTLIAVAALGLLVLPVYYHDTLNKTNNHEAVLLTEGFDADSLTAYSSVPIYTLNPDLRATANPRYIPDAAILHEVQPKITLLHILGSGLSEQQLHQISPLPVTYHPATAGGITTIHHTTQLNSGQRFQVQGQYHNISNKPVTLQLKGLGTLLDSVIIAAHKQSVFNLSTIPKSNGRNVYQVLALHHTDTLQALPLPVTIKALLPIKVLLLSATPDFENKFLKNWLNENGYAAAIRSSITKGKTSVEFVKMDKLALNQLTTGNLSQFDVVTADASALKALSATENAALHQQINEKGLGLIIRTDSSKTSLGWMQSGFTVTSPLADKQLTSKLTITGAQTPTSALSIAPYYVNSPSSAQVVVTDARDHALAACKLTGNGKIVFSTLNQTYAWALAGNTKDYGTIWAALLNVTARKKPATDQWFVSSPLPAENVPVKVNLQSGAAINTIQINQSVTPSQQQSLLPFEHTLTYWPQTAGWQQATFNRASFYWFAAKKDTWLTLKNQQNTKSTLLYAQNHRLNSPVTKKMQQIVRIEVPKVYFYVLLLLACSYLWAESRWFS